MSTQFIKKIAAVAILLVLGGAVSETTFAGDGYQIISTDALIEQLKSPDPPTLIFSLSRMEYEEQRIPKSICIPMELMANSADMPTNTDQPLVFYCKGPG